MSTSPRDPAATALSLRTINSPIGELRLIAGAKALVAVLWPEEREGRVRFESEPVQGSNNILDQTETELGEYFEGGRRSFHVPLELRGTEFQQTVWLALAEIPFGETSTYSKQAAAVGRPNAMRAVGSANGRNPLSIVLPCHRVVAANGGLAGFAGGLDTKRWLLDHERTVTAR